MRLSLLSLSKKLVVFMRLLSGERGQTLLALDVSRMVFRGDRVTFHISSLLKTSRPGWHKNVVTFSAFPHDVDLCVISALRCYLRITSPLRGGVSQLFLFLVLRTVRFPVVPSVPGRSLSFVCLALMSVPLLLVLLDQLLLVGLMSPYLLMWS